MEKNAADVAFAPQRGHRWARAREVPMSVQAVLLPVFVMVALTFVIMFVMGYARVSDIKTGKTHIRDIALGQPGWDTKATQFTRNFENQFQLPVLFYVLVAFALFTRKADLIFVVLSWVFVVCRIVHAYVHVTTNYVPYRFFVFAAGALVLTLMWVIFAVQILIAA
jgi:hypothetical protein